MTRNFLIRGMLAGLAAGLLAFLFAKLLGESPVDGAIAVEGRLAQLAGEVPEPELVSRAVQSTLGLFVGVVVYGIALGGIFGLVSAFALGRTGRMSPRATAALLAAAGFISIILVPFLKYPANPPSVGVAETIGYRTGLYFGVIAISVMAMIAAINLGRSLIGRVDRWHAVGVGALAYLAIVALAQFVLPNIDEVPAAFPATLLWQFRVASLGMQLVIWMAIGLVFGELSERSSAARSRSSAAVI